MQLPPLQPMSHDKLCVCGDVIIHPTAVIAPGVLLQANPGSRIVVAPGVCIGMGCVFHAYQGTLEIGPNANIGMGVLFLGAGQIGANACIGASCTLLNGKVAQHEVLPAGTLIGVSPQVAPMNPAEQPEVTSEQPSASPTSYESNGSGAFHSSTHSSTVRSGSNTTPETSSTPETQPGTVNEVYGRTYVNELLVKLMPHRQNLSPPQSEN